MSQAMSIDQLTDLLVSITVFLPRMALIFWTLPFLGRRILPGYIRVGIMICFVPAIYPLIALQHQPYGGGSVLIYLTIIMKEALIGFVFGFLVSIVFWVAESAGMLIDNQRGALSALMADAMPETQTTPWGNFLFHVAVVLFFLHGGFLDIMGAVFESYRIWPVYSFFPKIDARMSFFIIEQVGHLMRLCVVCAAPVVIASFAAEFGLGLVNRFAPQLNVFFISMPVKSLVGLVVMMLYVGFVITFFKGAFVQTNEMMKIMKAVVQ